MKENLATPYGLMLCAPPFVKTPREIMGGVIYNPGIKENAGIFSHTAELGRDGRVHASAMAIRPTSTTAPSCPPPTTTRAEVREIEPYVHCQTHLRHLQPQRRQEPRPVAHRHGLLELLHRHAVHPGHPPGDRRPAHRPLHPEPSGRASRCSATFRGKTLTIKVTNPNGKNKGISSLTVNGKRIQGNLIPLSEIKDGCVIEAVIDGTATAAPAAQSAGATAGR